MTGSFFADSGSAPLRKRPSSTGSFFGGGARARPSFRPSSSSFACQPRSSASSPPRPVSSGITEIDESTAPQHHGEVFKKPYVVPTLAAGVSDSFVSSADTSFRSDDVELDLSEATLVSAPASHAPSPVKESRVVPIVSSRPVTPKALPNSSPLPQPPSQQMVVPYSANSSPSRSIPPRRSSSSKVSKSVVSSSGSSSRRGHRELSAPPSPILSKSSTMTSTDVYGMLGQAIEREKLRLMDEIRELSLKLQQSETTTKSKSDEVLKLDKDLALMKNELERVLKQDEEHMETIQRSQRALETLQGSFKGVSDEHAQCETKLSTVVRELEDHIHEKEELYNSALLKIQELEQKNSTLSEDHKIEIDKFIKEIESLTRDLERTRMELKQSGDTLNEKKVEHKKEVQSLKDELRGEREFYKQERTELKNDSKAKADQHEKEAIQRKSELAEAKQCLATFQHQINALREEKTKVESNLIDTKAELEEKSRLLAAEHNELVALRITNEQSIVYLEVKTADLRALESQIECIISGLDSMSESAAKGEIPISLAQLAMPDAPKMTFELQVENLRSENASLSESFEFNRLGQEKALSEYHEMLETLRAQLEEKSAAYQTLSSDLGAKVTDGEKREEALQEKLSLVENKAKELGVQMTEMKKAEKQKDTEMKKLNASLEREKENSESLNGKCLALEESVAQLEATLDMQSKSTDLAQTERLNQVKAELARVEKELIEASSAIAKKDDLLETLQCQLEAVNHNKDTSVSQLKQENETLAAELREMKKQLADTEAQNKKSCDAMKENWKEVMAKKEADFRNELKRKDLAMSQMSPGSDQNKSATPTRPAPGPTSGLQASFSRIEQLHDDTLVEFQIKDMLNDLEFTDSPRHIGKAKPVMKPAPPQRKPFVPVVKNPAKRVPPWNSATRTLAKTTKVDKIIRASAADSSRFPQKRLTRSGSIGNYPSVMEEDDIFETH